MLITDFKEIVLIQMDRQNKTYVDLAKVIEKSPTYTRQVVLGMQNGPKAEKYRKKIADYLSLTMVKEG
ncbi:hypothetical protein IGI39_001955 [Enterococcus sp. AZ135]|uniref:hypothetical protein n=1 Tax=unclassified Enterococcus TaxID=2608891 RepID=UPI003F25DC60